MIKTEEEYRQDFLNMESQEQRLFLFERQKKLFKELHDIQNIITKLD
ncbi:hypothetical protein KY321_00460 [Candidatus Woesearchaeota archaeon]|nr:hypothetical protein [Candidatus Woesearchaeota archaeon]